MNDNSTRLNKFISESGLCSRREADRFIEQGNVFINGKRAGVGDRVFPGNQVMVNGQLLDPKETGSTIIIALNKPVGVTSTTEAAVRDNIVAYVNHSQRIFPIGRLDKDSQGLILLTNDGDIVNKILRAGNQHEKEYLVTVNKLITPQFIEAMGNGVPIMGVTTKKCMVKQESAFVFRIVLIQGLNRQIRRMCEYFDYEVTKLERIRIMNIGLKGLPVGDWRELAPHERDGIYAMIDDSTSEVQVKKASPKSNQAPKKNTPKKAAPKANANVDHRKRGGNAGKSHRPDNNRGGRKRR